MKDELKPITPEFRDHVLKIVDGLLSKPGAKGHASISRDITREQIDSPNTWIIGRDVTITIKILNPEDTEGVIP